MFKRRTSLLLLSLSSLLSLAACGGNVDTSSGGSGGGGGGGDTGSSDTSDPGKTYVEKDVYDALMKLAGAESYTATHSVGAEGETVTYHDVVTKDYVYYDDVRSGTVALESYDKKQYAGKLVYSFTLGTDDAVKIGSVARTYDRYNALVPVENLDDVRYMSYFTRNGFKVTEDVIKAKGENVFTSDNMIVNYVLASSMNMYRYYYYGYIRYMQFTFNGEGDLVISPMAQRSDTGAIVSMVDFTYTDIGTSHLAAIENTFGNYSLPAYELKEDALQSLQGDYGVSSKVYEQHGDDYAALDLPENEALLYESEVDWSGDFARRSTKTVQGEQAYFEQYERLDGVTYLTGLDGKNAPAKVTNGERLEKMTSLKDIDYRPFRALAEGADTYNYYGFKAGELAKTLLGFDTSVLRMGSVTDVKVTLAEGKVAGFDLLMDVMTDGYSLYRIHIVSTLRALNETAKEVTPYEEGDEIVKTALQKFDGSESFQLRFNDSYFFGNVPEDRTELTYDKDKKVAYVEDIAKNVVTKRYGYLVKEEGIVPFEVRDGKLVETNAPDTRHSFADLLGVNLDYRVLEAVKTDETTKDVTYALKGNIVSIKDDLYLGPNKDQDSMILPSFSLKVSASGFLREYRYSYGSNTNIITPIYLDSVSLPTDLDFGKVTAFNEPTSWAEENQTILNRLTGVLGEHAEDVPYLFDRDLMGQWSSLKKGDTVRIYSYYDSDDYGNHFDTLGYMKRYEEALVNDDWSKEGEDENGFALYQKGVVQIAVGRTLYEGVVVSLINQ